MENITETHRKNEHPGRSVKLDILRIVLCLGVFYSHFGWTPGIAIGSVCVMGFFVLSGYLMQSSFYKTKDDAFNAAKFYSSKAKRFLPIYLIAFFISIIAAYLISWRDGVDMRIPPLNVAEFSLFKFARFWNTPAWYMECLFVFILLAPFLHVLHRTRWGIFFLFIVLLTYASFLYWYYDGTSYTKLGMQAALYYSPWSRLWEILAGMLACRACSHVSATTKRKVGWVATIVLLPLMVLLTYWVYVYCGHGYTMNNSFSTAWRL